MIKRKKLNFKIERINAKIEVAIMLKTKIRPTLRCRLPPFFKKRFKLPENKPILPKKI